MPNCVPETSVRACGTWEASDKCTLQKYVLSTLFLVELAWGYTRDLLVVSLGSVLLSQLGGSGRWPWSPPSCSSEKWMQVPWGQTLLSPIWESWQGPCFGHYIPSVNLLILCHLWHCRHLPACVPHSLHVSFDPCMLLA